VAAFLVAVVREPPADPRLLAPYAEQIEATLAPYGGRYRVVPDGRTAALEGDWRPPRGLVVIEFPTFEQALAWYHSPAYAPLLALRQAHARLDVLLVDGLADGETVLARRGSRPAARDEVP
jgi:uncharacterized protein (DUF1330 family)